ncbi:1-acyl-sn-glycerol-3-phosphate acyltransferase [Aliikangiella sp. G2MR2-5]|uniref:1-acyl-sn-glycerol-3-phosphate acyltransferase n=1 Tax=Aliikangiella sp. G2MR2-5 TaxID=2788943 RepID=UPI0018AB0C08|nr:1-acyl-sn-glycerol-3-phosphate acyltransferase [Aliikangiella sp. G2MR2-5]
MSQTVTIPVWLFFLLLFISLIVFINRLLFPGVRWFFRKKVNKAIEELNQRLNIEIRPFQLTKRQVLLDRLVHDSQVLTFVQKQSLEDEIPREVLLEKVRRYASEIVPSFNAYIYYRVGYWLSKKLTKLLYSVRVNQDQQEKLINLNKESTVVFVMNHRSNMDYILVSFLVAEKMALSYAVGEWAKVWPLHSLIKSMGAYFVRRNSRNPLYRKVLERYIDMATREGVCQAVFPEGGLTRDGKLRSPKLGFLDYMLRNYDFERDRDIIFIPVGINYDRVLEDRTLLLSLRENEAKPGRWYTVKTTFRFIWNNLRLAQRHQWQRYGFACVNFDEPISCQNYCLKNSVNFSLLSTKKRFEAVESLACYLMNSVEKTVPAVPVTLICATLSRFLIASEQNQVERSLIVEEAQQLMFRIEKEDGKVLFPNKDKKVMLEAAIDRLILRRIISEENKMLRVSPEQDELISYYANSIFCWK